MESSIEKFIELVSHCDNIVFFGGAGVSTESGIPDFRSIDGLYSQKYKYPPETILSHDFFVKNTAEFYRFYRDKMIFPDSEPNYAHKALSELEKKGKLRAIVTQNIDNLHQKSGSNNVLELHGSVYRNYCMKCQRFYNLSYILETKNIPLCECGGIIKPDVVLYQEGLDKAILEKSVNHIASADMLIIGGTSLGVYPAASLVDYFSGRNLVLINKGSTSKNCKASIVIDALIGEVFKNFL